MERRKNEEISDLIRYPRLSGNSNFRVTEQTPHLRGRNRPSRRGFWISAAIIRMRTRGIRRGSDSPPGGNLGRSHAQRRVNRAAIQGTRPQIYRGKSRESNAEVRFEAPVMGVAKSQIHDNPLHPHTTATVPPSWGSAPPGGIPGLRG